MRARDLATPQPTVREDAPAAEVARILAREDVRAAMVVNEGGRVVGVLSDSLLLRELLPSYVEEAQGLAGVLGEAAADVAWRRLEGLLVRDLLADEREVVPVVQGDDNLIEVAAIMVRAHLPLVGVTDNGADLIGGITIADLLDRLLQST